MRRKGIIFDIKKFAVHDGPGIRSTVFFKGCPLRCLWCHNPEGISSAPEIMVFAGRCLKDCRDCLAACPKNALNKKGRRIILDRVICDGCGACSRACPAEALKLAGRLVTADQALEQLAKDSAFFRDSGGGITCSGGEPLLQPQFLRQLLVACRRQNLHAAVDTCGHAPFAAYEKILPLTGLFLYDLKLMDDSRHKRLTGVSNRLLLSNLQKLSRSAGNLAIRVPLVPGCNDSAADMAEMADFCASLPNRHPVHLLPYHRGGSGKSQRLGRGDPMAATLPPTPDAIRKTREIFLKRKLAVTIGG